MGTLAVLGEICELASFTCRFSKNLPGFGSLYFSLPPLPPILHMRGAMEEATRPNAEPPPLFPPLVKLPSGLFLS